jgi:hypothetical protein
MNAFPVLLEGFGKSWHENYVSHRVARLRRHVPALAVESAPNTDQLLGEVDIPPAEGEQLALSQSTEHRCREQRPILRRCCIE